MAANLSSILKWELTWEKNAPPPSIAGKSTKQAVWQCRPEAPRKLRLIYNSILQYIHKIIIFVGCRVWTSQMSSIQEGISSRLVLYQHYGHSLPGS